MGVTCETTKTVAPPCSAMIRLRARRTRWCTVSKLSPSGGVIEVSLSHWRCSSGSRSDASEKVRPSHLPKSVSIRSSSTVSGTPRAPAAAAAVSLARLSGELITAAMPPRLAR
ncbi:Uncharacterised protein [Mycobacteroides abscessus subsp. abscessus]|nr:Uncharacterised protein [Mycobacteroides abscessus subsp. abscessus]